MLVMIIIEILERFCLASVGRLTARIAAPRSQRRWDETFTTFEMEPTYTNLH